jgi:C-terminal processing protease CtpA/Prc
MEVSLSCFLRGGYGLILHRAPSPFHDQTISPPFISYIERGSPADKSGVLQVGDRVLAINDWCTGNGTVEEANERVRRCQGQLNLTVEFDVIETVLPSSGVFTVKLAKRCPNLGLVVCSSGSQHRPGLAGPKGEPVMVADVRTGSVAHRCGSINSGDQLLSIDNIPLDTCTVEEACRLLQRTTDIVKLRIRKGATSGEDAADSGPQTVVYTVELNRKGGPLGVTIVGTENRYEPIFISQLAPGGLAEKTGALHIGDRILAINNVSLDDKRVSEAMQLLQSATETVQIKIGRTVDPVGPTVRFDPVRQTPVLPFPLHRDPLGDQDSSDKLGTPVHSIDSAVESLEDSPETVQSGGGGSNRHSQNSKSSMPSNVGDSHKYGKKS